MTAWFTSITGAVSLAYFLALKASSPGVPLEVLAGAYWKNLLLIVILLCISSTVDYSCYKVGKK